MKDTPSAGMYASAGFSLFAGMTLNDWAVLVGIVVAVLGLLINLWHKRQIVRIEQERLEFEKQKRQPRAMNTLS
ncbi:MAG: holin [Pseudomonadota bacterium]